MCFFFLVFLFCFFCLCVRIAQDQIYLFGGSFVLSPFNGSNAILRSNVLENNHDGTYNSTSASSSKFVSNSTFASNTGESTTSESGGDDSGNTGNNNNNNSLPQTVVIILIGMYTYDVIIHSY